MTTAFTYADEKCLVLAKKIKKLVDDRAQFADWSTCDDIKNQLTMAIRLNGAKKYLRRYRVG